MVNFRRNFIPGGTYFFTVALADRNSKLLTEHVNKLRNAFRKAQLKYPFTIDAIVTLPDHIHTIWTLPPDDSHYPKRWQAIKSHFTRSLRVGGIFLKKMPKENMQYGSAVIGNTQSETSMISINILITSTIIP